MGINKQALKLLLAEHSYNSIIGDYVSIGKQTVQLPINEIAKHFQEYGISVDQLNLLKETGRSDTSTRAAGRELGGIFDHDMIASFSDANYVCLDRSPYEGADIIHDMNSPLPVELVGKYDFIYNGSCMDNIFDPVSFIRNTSKMLKVGGRLLMTEAVGPNPGAYLTFSPQWFFSFFAVNNFVDCKVYLVVGRDPGPNRYMYDCDLFLWKPDFTRIEGYDYHAACRTLDGLSHVLILAEKGPDSTDDQSPIQLQYMDDQAADWTKKYEAFSKSDRPILNAPVKRENVILPYNSDHHIYLGSRF